MTHTVCLFVCLFVLWCSSRHAQCSDNFWQGRSVRNKVGAGSMIQNYVRSEKICSDLIRNLRVIQVSLGALVTSPTTSRSFTTFSFVLASLSSCTSSSFCWTSAQRMEASVQRPAPAQERQHHTMCQNLESLWPHLRVSSST